MTILEQLVEYARETLVINKDVDNNFIVSFDHSGVYTNPGALGECGRGKTIEEAAKDYVTKISGKTLVFNYGTPSERFAKFIMLIKEDT